MPSSNQAKRKLIKIQIIKKLNLNNHRLLSSKIFLELFINFRPNNIKNKLNPIDVMSFKFIMKTSKNELCKSKKDSEKEIEISINTETKNGAYNHL